MNDRYLKRRVWRAGLVGWVLISSALAGGCGGPPPPSPGLGKAETGIAPVLIDRERTLCALPPQDGRFTQLIRYRQPIRCFVEVIDTRSGFRLSAVEVDCPDDEAACDRRLR